MAAPPTSILVVLALAVALLSVLAAPAFVLLPSRTAAAADHPAAAAVAAASTAGGSCDSSKAPNLGLLSSCIKLLLASTPIDRLEERQKCCGIVRGAVASGERCVCEFVEEATASLRFLFDENKFEPVCGDISLKRHCKE